MRRVLLVVAFLGCKQNEPPPPALPPPALPPPAAQLAPAPLVCDLTGSYRLRFRSNGTDGWWFAFSIGEGKAQLTHTVSMYTLKPGPLAFKGDGCTAHLEAKSENAGTVGLTFTLDPTTHAITGEMTRQKGTDGDSFPAKQTITGRRDVGGPGGPPCLKAGVFKLATGKTKWELSEGHPRAGLGCGDFAATNTTCYVRIQPYDGAIIVDEASDGEQGYGQSFRRGQVKRLGECDIELHLEVQDYDFTAKLTLAGDRLTGTAPEAHYQFMEDGTAGENLWGCKAKDVAIVGTRVAD